MRTALVMAAAAVSVTAGAQDVGKFPHSAEQEYQSSASVRMGRCLVGRSRKEAIGLVVADDQPSYRTAYGRAQQDLTGCLQTKPSATLDGVQMRGAMAEALLADRDGVLLSRAAHLAPVPATRVAVTSDALAVISCASAADPMDAVAMLRAPAESVVEMTAFQNMAPALQACVPMSGAVSLKPKYVRAMTAVSLYRHVTAGAAGGVQ